MTIFTKKILHATIFSAIALTHMARGMDQNSLGPINFSYKLYDMEKIDYKNAAFYCGKDSRKTDSLVLEALTNKKQTIKKDDPCCHIIIKYNTQLSPKGERALINTLWKYIEKNAPPNSLQTERYIKSKKFLQKAIEGRMYLSVPLSFFNLSSNNGEIVFDYIKFIPQNANFNEFKDKMQKLWNNFCERPQICFTDDIDEKKLRDMKVIMREKGNYVDHYHGIHGPLSPIKSGANIYSQLMKREIGRK